MNNQNEKPKKGDIYENKRSNSLYSPRVEILGNTKLCGRNAIGFIGLGEDIVQSDFIGEFLRKYQKLNNIFPIKNEKKIY